MPAGRFSTALGALITFLSGLARESCGHRLPNFLLIRALVFTHSLSKTRWFTRLADTRLANLLILPTISSLASHE